MAIVNVNVHVDASEVLSELDDDDFQQEVERRQKTACCAGSLTDRELLERVYLEMRGKECSESLREYIYRTLGRIL